jgi:hypothetical protein
MASSFVDKAKKRLFDSLPLCFVDPATAGRPQDEEQLSGLLGLFHQLGRISWCDVPLWLPTNERAEAMADTLFTQTVVCAEYQLFSTCAQEKNVWGQMRADLIFLARDGRTVCILENKIGGDFTYKNDPQQQLDRQLAFLAKCKISSRFLVLLSSGDFFEGGWYAKQLAKALEGNTLVPAVAGYLIKWEDVLKALH